MRFMTFDFGRSRNMRTYSLLDIVRPPNVTNSIITRVFKYINIPRSIVSHICIVPHIPCGYKHEQSLCGYDGEHAMPDGWTGFPWKARGGYGSQGNKRGRENAHKEMIWFSPHCLPVHVAKQPGLFAEVPA